MSVLFNLPDEVATDRFGSELARVLQGQGGVILLKGELGAGKTSLVRAAVHALGYQGRVVSPSYTLIEPYEIGSSRVFHMDLYRLCDPEELEYLGVRDIAPDADLLFVEWPENGNGMLPPHDLLLSLKDADPGRQLEVESNSERGVAWLRRLHDNHRSVG